MKTFECWQKRFDQNDLRDFSLVPEALLWLKLRSIDRKDLLSQYCDRIGITYCRGVVVKIWEMLNEDPRVEACLRDYMAECQEKENVRIDSSFETIRSNLYKMNHFHWGGGSRNSLDKAIVTRYVKTDEIIPYDRLSMICEGELLDMSRGYLYNSWYNYWSSVLIENVFRRNNDVMPAYGKIKNVDFFVKDFPFDLKVTYVPKEFSKLVRKEQGMDDPLKKLRRYAKSKKMVFDSSADDESQQYEISEKIKDSGNSSGLELLAEIRDDWRKIVNIVVSDKHRLITWLYENQGEMRFGAENRIFLVMVDRNDPAEAWKLKRNIDLIRPCVSKWISTFKSDRAEDLRLKFSYKSKTYDTFADAIFVMKD